MGMQEYWYLPYNNITIIYWLVIQYIILQISVMIVLVQKQEWVLLLYAGFM